MKQTNYDQKIFFQRGFQKGLTDYVLKHGTLKYQEDGVREYSISKRQKDILVHELKQLVKKVEKSSNKAILLDESSNTLITAYNIIN